MMGLGGQHSRFPHLFQPLALRGVTLPNRAAVSGHFAGWWVAEHGMPSDRFVAYVEERAKGGVGLFVIGATSPMPGSGWMENTSDSIIPRYKLLTEAGRRHGTPIFAQLCHPGFKPLPGPAIVKYVPHVPGPFHPAVRHIPSIGELQELIAAFGQAAGRAAAGGVDGVELHSHESFLHAQMLNPLWNERTDEYGGSLENRMRFMVETLQAMRAAIPPTMPLGVRLKADDMEQRGMGPAEYARLLQRLEAGGLADYVTLTGGDARLHHGPTPRPEGEWLPLVANLRAGTRIPIMHAGRINTPEMAEEAVRRGMVDVVCMTKTHIADPHFMRKVWENRLDDIRYCTRCLRCHGQMGNMACIYNPLTSRELAWSGPRAQRAPANSGGTGPRAQRAPANPGGTNTGPLPRNPGGTNTDPLTPNDPLKRVPRGINSGPLNPSSGRESSGSPASNHGGTGPLIATSGDRQAPDELVVGPIQLAAWERSVVVVGGGPAGMEAAMTAVARGHRVTLLEKSARVGGQTWTAAGSPLRSAFGRVAEFYTRQAAKAAFDIRLNCTATPELVLSLEPEVVILATGSVPLRPVLSGNAMPVFTVHEVVAGKANGARRVVVLDREGGPRALVAADLLSSGGVEVEFVTPLRQVAPKIEVMVADEFVDQFLQRGMNFWPGMEIAAVENGTVRLESLFGQVSVVLERIEAVIGAVGSEPVGGELADTLQGRGLEVHVIGDAREPRTCEEATVEGAEAGRAV